MGQLLHGCARKTETVRRAIQRSSDNIATLAERYHLNPKTVAKWKKRAFTCDAPMGPKRPRSRVLTREEEALVVAFRKHTLLPLDDCLYKVRESPSRISKEKAEEQSARAWSVMHREHRALLGDDYDPALSDALILGSEIGFAAVRYGTQLAIRLAERKGFSAPERTIVLRRLYDRVTCAANTTVLHKAAARLLRGGHTSFRALRAALPG